MGNIDGFHAGDYAYFVIKDASTWFAKMLRIDEAILDAGDVYYSNQYGKFPANRVFSSYEKANEEIIRIMLD